MNLHPMRLIDGWPGISQRLKYEYRGQIIVRTYRSHDVRNKTHRGYDWYVEFMDGTQSSTGSRTDAKARVDAYWERKA